MLVGWAFIGRGMREFCGVMEMFYLDLSGGYTGVYISNHQGVHLRWCILSSITHQKYGG